ncbi:MAG: hypothetical protein HY674_15945, partial [Chloroflexi bacterium]|nr:hypothetical protein [Chloroflexota bacterium]
ASYPYYPSVFRPVFTGTSSNVVISGYVEETNSAFVSYPWREVENLITASPTTYSNINVYGQPVVIGAKKGFPNFNEFTLQTVVQVTRKLELRKSNANVNTRPNQTNQMYILGITNMFGMEGWNSYAQDYRRPFEIRATNYYALALSNVVNGITNLLRYRVGSFSTNINGTNWPGNTNRYFFPTANSFILPIDTGYAFLTNSAYISTPPSFADSTLTNNFERTFNPPLWHLYQTNRLQYILIDRVANRVLDFVNLDNMTTHMDIATRLYGVTNAVRDLYSDATISEGDFWDTNRVGGVNSLTLGALKQLQVSLGEIPVSQAFWRSYNNDPVAGNDKPKSMDAFRVFMGTNQLTGNRFGPLGTSHQTPFTPTRKLYQKTSWQANDPLVHYMVLDLFDPYLVNPDGTNNNAIIRPPNTPLPQSNLGLLNERYRPWGRSGQRTVTVNDFRYQTRDPLVWRSDDWSFPTNTLGSNWFKFPTIGWLGRIHRGTPWQTIYFKSSAERTNVWLFWAGSYGTHPTNDWRFADVFTVAPNENAARGLLSVNQTNLAAWSAVLSGVGVISNTVPSATFASQPRTLPQFTDLFIPPASTQLVAIVAGINRTRSRYPNGAFQRIGDVLATPELTDLSPFLNLSVAEQYQYGVSDQAYERLPLQILSLLKADEPRLVVYAFGQSLKPAERSLVTSGNFYNLCTNYQITGEVVTKTVLRVEGDLSQRNTPLRAVVESYNVLPPD